MTSDSFGTADLPPEPQGQPEHRVQDAVPPGYQDAPPPVGYPGAQPGQFGSQDPSPFGFQANPTPYQDPAQFGQNPAPFGQNPGQFPQNPGQFGQNPAPFGQNPGQFGQNPGQFGQPMSYGSQRRMSVYGASSRNPLGRLLLVRSGALRSEQRFKVSRRSRFYRPFWYIRTAIWVGAILFYLWDIFLKHG